MPVESDSKGPQLPFSLHTLGPALLTNAPTVQSQLMRKGEEAPSLPLGSLWFDWGEEPWPTQGCCTAGAEPKAPGLVWGGDRGRHVWGMGAGSWEKNEWMNCRLTFMVPTGYSLWETCTSSSQISADPSMLGIQTFLPGASRIFQDPPKIALYIGSTNAHTHYRYDWNEILTIQHLHHMGWLICFFYVKNTHTVCDPLNRFHGLWSLIQKNTV